MSDDSYATAGEAIRQGVLGRVVQAQIEYVRRYDRQGPWRERVSHAHAAKPADLDWDTWLGHAKKVDWNPHHFFEWRCYSAYSGGIATDLFIHRISRIMKACDLQYPRRVVGMGGIWQWPDGRDLPDNFEMICEYPRGMTVYVLGTQSNRVGRRTRDPRLSRHALLHGGGLGRQATRTARSWPNTKRSKNSAKICTTITPTCTTTCETANRSIVPIELGMAGVVAVNMANESWRHEPGDGLGRREAADGPGPHAQI